MRGHKHVLGLWIEQSEGAKFWLRVMNELKNRGVDDILFAVVDGLKGFPDAITAVFPRAIVQTCIVHLIRHSLSFVSWQDRKRLMPALRAIYRAETAEGRAAARRLRGRVGQEVPGDRPGLAARLERGRAVLRLSATDQKMIYTTDEIDKRFCVRRGSFSCASDLVAKCGATAGSAARCLTPALPG